MSDRKVVEFRIVWDSSRDEFEESVNLFLSEKWELLGNMIVNGLGPFDFMQVMVRYAD